MPSRLSFYCLKCKRSGSRNESLVKPEGSDDSCPWCGADDVEVYDPQYSGPSDELELYVLKAHSESQRMS